MKIGQVFFCVYNPDYFFELSIIEKRIIEGKKNEIIKFLDLQTGKTHGQLKNIFDNWRIKTI